MIINILYIIALFVFFLGVLYKIFRLKSVNPELRFEISPVLENQEMNVKPKYFSLIFDELFFLKSLWIKNPKLWYAAFPLHLSVYISIINIFLVIILNLVFFSGNSELIHYTLPFFSSLININTIFASIIGSISVAFMVYLKGGKFHGNNRFSIPLGILLAIYFFSMLGWFALDANFIANFSSVIFYLYSFTPIPGFNLFSSIHLIILMILLLITPFSKLDHFLFYFFSYKKIEINEFYELNDENLYNILNEKYNLNINWISTHISLSGENTWVGTLNSSKEENG